jgi:hypothetical protein
MDQYCCQVVMHPLRQQVDQREIRELMREIDLNGDGSIGFYVSASAPRTHASAHWCAADHPHPLLLMVDSFGCT